MLSQRLAGRIVRALYCRRRQYITVQPVGLAEPLAPTKDTQCVVVDSVEELQALAASIPATFRDSVDELQRRVAHGCVVCLAIRTGTDGRRPEVVGYELAERAVFSALGRRRRVSGRVVFSHWAEVLPTYRGQRIHGLLFAARDAYFHRRGGTIVCGVVAPENVASIRALARAGSSIAGTVQRVSVLGGLLVWQTPWARIERAVSGSADTAAA